MKQKTIRKLLLFLMALLIAPSGAWAGHELTSGSADVSGLAFDATPSTGDLWGNGDTGTPYVIRTVQGWTILATAMANGVINDNNYAQFGGGNKLAKAYVTVAGDLDVTGIKKPLGSYSPDNDNPLAAGTAFKGHFDGGGHTFSGTVDVESAYFGLFGDVDGADIANFNVDGLTINNCYSNTALVVGYLRSGSVSGIVIENSNVVFKAIDPANIGDGITGFGGVVGSMLSGTVSDVTLTTVLVNGVNGGHKISAVGAVVGSMTGGTFDELNPVTYDVTSTISGVNLADNSNYWTVKTANAPTVSEVKQKVGIAVGTAGYPYDLKGAKYRVTSITVAVTDDTDAHVYNFGKEITPVASNDATNRVVVKDATVQIPYDATGDDGFIFYNKNAATEYKYTITDNTEAGTANIRVQLPRLDLLEDPSAKAPFIDRANVDWTIHPKNMNTAYDLALTPAGPVTYDGVDRAATVTLSEMKMKELDGTTEHSITDHNPDFNAYTTSWEYSNDGGSSWAASAKVEEAGQYRLVVEGNTNFTGTVKSPVFVVNKLELQNTDEAAAGYVDFGTITPPVYTGSALEPAYESGYPTVTLTAGGTPVALTEYATTFDNNINAGVNTAKKIITANVASTKFTGSVTKLFTILPKALKNEAAGWTTWAVTGKTYNGTEQTAEVITVTDAENSNALVFGTDFELADGSGKGTDAGDYTVKVKGKGNYDPDVTITLAAVFTISPKSIADVTFTLDPSEYTYTGSAIEPATSTFTVTDDAIMLGDPATAKALVAGTDYTVAYSDNVNVGTATITLTGKGNYDTGTTKSATFTITKLSLETAKIVCSADAGTYDYFNKKPSDIKVYFDKNDNDAYDAGTDLLVPDDQYDLTYKDRLAADFGAYAAGVHGYATNAGNVLVKATAKTGAGINYKDATDGTHSYAIAPKALKNTWTWTVGSKEYNATEQQPSVFTVQDEDIDMDGLGNHPDLTFGTDFELVDETGYNKGTEVGTYDVKVKGLDANCNYTTAAIVLTPKFEITKRTINQTDIEITYDPASYKYTGHAIEPADDKYTVVDKGIIIDDTDPLNPVYKTLVLGTDFTVAFTNNVNAGTNTAVGTFTGAGNYKDDKTANFSIVARSLTEAKINFSTEDITYAYKDQKPATINVWFDLDGDDTYDAGEEIPAADYTLTFKDTQAGDFAAFTDPAVPGAATNAGQVFVKATKKSANVTDATDGTDKYVILQKALNNTWTTVIDPKTYNGQTQSPTAITVTDGDTSEGLTLGDDFDLVIDETGYPNVGYGINAGNYYVRVVGKKNYKETIQLPVQFTINKLDISTLTADNTAQYYYTYTLGSTATAPVQSYNADKFDADGTYHYLYSSKKIDPAYTLVFNYQADDYAETSTYSTITLTPTDVTSVSYLLHGGANTESIIAGAWDLKPTADVASVNFTGTLTIENAYFIDQRPLTDAVVIYDDPTPVTFTNTDVTPTNIKVFFDDVLATGGTAGTYEAAYDLLVDPAEYAIQYKDAKHTAFGGADYHKNAGEVYVQAKAEEINYTLTSSADAYHFTITPKTLLDAAGFTWVPATGSNYSDKTYNGTAQTPAETLSIEDDDVDGLGNAYTLDVPTATYPDYTVEWKDAENNVVTEFINAGTYTQTITATGNYTGGPFTRTFTITPIDITTAAFKTMLAANNLTFEYLAETPTNPEHQGPVSFATTHEWAPTASLFPNDIKFMGKDIVFTVVMKNANGDPQLTDNVMRPYDSENPTNPYDYEVTYSNNGGAGVFNANEVTSPYVKIAGHGNYTGELKQYFTITKQYIGWIDVTELLVPEVGVLLDREGTQKVDIKDIYGNVMINNEQQILAVTRIKWTKTDAPTDRTGYNAEAGKVYTASITLEIPVAKRSGYELKSGFGANDALVNDFPSTNRISGTYGITIDLQFPKTPESPEFVFDPYTRVLTLKGVKSQDTGVDTEMWYVLNADEEAGIDDVLAADTEEPTKVKKTLDAFEVNTNTTARVIYLKTNPLSGELVPMAKGAKETAKYFITASPALGQDGNQVLLENIDDLNEIYAMPYANIPTAQLGTKAGENVASDYNGAAMKLYYFAGDKDYDTEATDAEAEVKSKLVAGMADWTEYTGKFDVPADKKTVWAIALVDQKIEGAAPYFHAYSKPTPLSVELKNKLVLAHEWNTYMADKDYAVPAGLKVYTISGMVDNKVTVTEQAKIQANVPVLLKQVDDASVTYYLSNKQAAGIADYDGTLDGFDKSEAETAFYNVPNGKYTGVKVGNTFDVTATADVIYVLKNNEFIRANRGEVAEKLCFLAMTSNQRNFVRIYLPTDEETVIDTIEAAENVQGEWYNVKGMKLDEAPTQKGVYIFNGRKVVIK